MTEFLTENAHRAYPLDGEWPEALRENWEGVLLDACVYTTGELAPGERIKLLSVRRLSSELLFRVGTSSSAALTARVGRGLGGFATVYAQDASTKAILTVDGRKAAALAAGADTQEMAVDVPFAMRCSGGGTKRVTSITAQGAETGTTPAYSPTAAAPVEKSVQSGEHAFLKAYDGVDLEVTGMAPLQGSVLRVSAIAAPEAADADEEPVDIMIRGDECFAVEARPNADRTGGTVKITGTCKPCCQCEDYADAIGLLRPAEAKTWKLNGDLDKIEAGYRAALAKFAASKDAVIARINSVDNVFVSATATASGGMYGQSTASGTRARLLVSMLVENMTMKTVDVAVGADGANSGFSIPAVTIDNVSYSYAHSKTLWAKAGPGGTSGSGRPISASLAPGETLSVSAYYCIAGFKTNNAPKPTGMKAYCTVTMDGTATGKEVTVL